MLNYGGRIRMIEGDREVLPGLRVHRVGGHTCPARRTLSRKASTSFDLAAGMPSSASSADR
jgi:hypothetical protein